MEFTSGLEERLHLLINRLHALRQERAELRELVDSQDKELVRLKQSQPSSRPADAKALDDLRRQCDNLRSERDDLRGERDDLQGRLAAIEAELATLQTLRNERGDMVKTLNGAIDRLRQLEEDWS